MSSANNKSSTLELTLFAENTAQLQFPREKAEWVAQHTHVDTQCVDLVRNGSMAQVLHTLRHMIRLLPRLGGKERCLSIMKFSEQVRPNQDCIILNQEEINILATQETVLEYAYYSRFHRETRFRNTAGFFLLSFPADTPTPLPQPNADCCYVSRYKNQNFLLTTDMNELDAYLESCATMGMRFPALRIDYFSCGSFIRWYLCPDTLGYLSSLNTGLELHIHPAMLVDKNSTIHAISRHILRSKLWRKRLYQG